MITLQRLKVALEGAPMVGPHLTTNGKLIAGRFLPEGEEPILLSTLLSVGRINHAKYLVVFYEADIGQQVFAYPPDHVYYVMPGEDVSWVEDRLAHAGHTSRYDL